MKKTFLWDNWKPWRLRGNIHLSWSQSPTREYMYYNNNHILESKNGRTWMLDASRVGLWAGWFWCWSASKFVGWRRKIAKKGGICMLLSTSPPCKICKSGATHSFPSHGEWVHLIRLGVISSVARTWLCNWSHTSHAFFARKIFHQCQKHNILQNYCSVDQKPLAFCNWRPFDVTIVTT